MPNSASEPRRARPWPRREWGQRRRVWRAEQRGGRRHVVEDSLELSFQTKLPRCRFEWGEEAPARWGGEVHHAQVLEGLQCLREHLARAKDADATHAENHGRTPGASSRRLRRTKRESSRRRSALRALYVLTRSSARVAIRPNSVCSSTSVVCAMRSHPDRSSSSAWVARAIASARAS